MNRLNQIILEGTVSGELIIPTDGYCKMIIPTMYIRTTKDTKEVLNIDVEYNGHLSEYKMKFLKTGRIFRVVGHLASRTIENETKLVIIADYIDFRPVEDLRRINFTEKEDEDIELNF